jgi:hypothetical protein
MNGVNDYLLRSEDTVRRLGCNVTSGGQFLARVVVRRQFPDSLSTSDRQSSGRA